MKCSADAVRWCLDVQLALLDEDWPQALFEHKDSAIGMKLVYFVIILHLKTKTKKQTNRNVKKESKSVSVQRTSCAYGRALWRAACRKGPDHHPNGLFRTYVRVNHMSNSIVFMLLYRVNRSARVEGATYGGQIVVSSSVVAALG